MSLEWTKERDGYGRWRYRAVSGAMHFEFSSYGGGWYTLSVTVGGFSLESHQWKHYGVDAAKEYCAEVTFDSLVQAEREFLVRRVEQNRQHMESDQVRLAELRELAL